LSFATEDAHVPPLVGRYDHKLYDEAAGIRPRHSLFDETYSGIFFEKLEATFSTVVERERLHLHVKCFPGGLEQYGSMKDGTAGFGADIDLVVELGARYIESLNAPVTEKHALPLRWHKGDFVNHGEVTFLAREFISAVKTAVSVLNKANKSAVPLEVVDAVESGKCIVTLTCGGIKMDVACAFVDQSKTHHVLHHDGKCEHSTLQSPTQRNTSGTTLYNVPWRSVYSTTPADKK